ncbi:hypothetical protein SAMN04488066_107124 [Halorubrum aquaticum]|uniref:GATase domain protein n=1 Tax=Halorubrum aquaticum TaxID=387340 RepID=A0A1I3AWB1_9EURY|nr:hypothetical protein [Halorubrum aquaticum]SFH53631.1 hypothetical protein SAMN04488066_107124 [Halorubrum aquaticum]
MSRIGTLAVAFLVTFATIAGGAAVAGYATADGAAPAPEIENEHYQSTDVIEDDDPGEATVELSSDAESQTVLIDPGVQAASGGVAINPLSLIGMAGGGVADRDIRPLANALIENGHDVRVYTPEANQQQFPSQPGASGPTPLGEDLAEADAFVTFRTDYGEDELADIETFVEADGRMVLATEPDATFSQSGPTSLDATLGTTTEPGYVYNMAENDLNYQRVYAEPTGDSALTEGVDRAMFSTVTPVGTAAEGGDEFRPIDGSELSTTRSSTDAPLLARDDGVVVVGDSDFLSPENAARADNDVLIGNLADFLVENDRDPETQPPETQPEGPTGPTAPTQPTQPPTQPEQPPTNTTNTTA